MSREAGEQPCNLLTQWPRNQNVVIIYFWMHNNEKQVNIYKAVAKHSDRFKQGIVSSPESSCPTQTSSYQTSQVLFSRVGSADKIKVYHHSATSYSTWVGIWKKVACWVTEYNMVKPSLMLLSDSFFLAS